MPARTTHAALAAAVVLIALSASLTGCSATPAKPAAAEKPAGTAQPGGLTPNVQINPLGPANTARQGAAKANDKTNDVNGAIDAATK